MNYYKHHIGDYAKKTAHLSVLEHGAYLLMLHAYYGTEKPLPFGRDLYRICRAFGKKERAAVDKVAAQFWTRTEVGFVNGRAFDEIESASHLRETAQENGKGGGRPKKPSGLSENNPAGLISEPTGKAIQTPDSNTPVTITKKEQDGGREKPRAARSAPGTRIPENFELSEDRRAYAKDRGVEASATFEAFTLYWSNKPKDATKLDWDKTWRSWVLREAKDQKQRIEPRKTRFAQLTEKLEAQINGD